MSKLAVVKHQEYARLMKTLETMYGITGYNESGWTLESFVCPWCYENRDGQDDVVEPHGYLWLGLDPTWIPQFHCFTCGRQMSVDKLAAFLELDSRLWR